MSDAREIIASLFEVLSEERTAIRRLDAATVERTTRAKEAAIEKLIAIPHSEFHEVRGDVARLRAELRRNTVLLAHAASCLRAALEQHRTRSGLIEVQV